MRRIKMCNISELEPGTSVEKRIFARRVAVFNDEGKLYGIESDCKHMKASLVNSEVQDSVVKCRWHGWKYDLRTGKCLTVDGVKLRRYEVEVVDGDVVLLMD